jgi:hypothetical protein
MQRADTPLWHCPRCGHPFVNRNQWHSCGTFDLDAHFAGCAPGVRALFDELRAIVERNGPVTVEPQKTRIVFVVRVRFGGVMVRKRSLNAHLWLRRRVEHPRVTHVESFGALGYGIRFNFDRPGQMDDAFVELVREAYAIGCGRG